MNKESITNILIKLSKNSNILFFITTIFIIFLLILCNLFFNNIQHDISSTQDLIDKQDYKEIEETQNTIETIKIHISGEVKVPGIYELPKGSRIANAIEIAEGLTINANIAPINLAYELSDGQKIIIPNQDQQDETYNYIQENSCENILDNVNTINQKININTASKDELSSLSGIGISTAEKIIQYRQEHGKFQNIEDIKNVNGIGENKFAKIKDFIKTK